MIGESGRRIHLGKDKVHIFPLLLPTYPQTSQALHILDLADFTVGYCSLAGTTLSRVDEVFCNRTILDCGIRSETLLGGAYRYST